MTLVTKSRSGRHRSATAVNQPAGGARVEQAGRREQNSSCRAVARGDVECGDARRREPIDRREERERNRSGDEHTSARGNGRRRCDLREDDWHQQKHDWCQMREVIERLEDEPPEDELVHREEQ